ncbi:uncharacterized protein BO80DRAFT_392707 [Aspergillus ibericus CBS 121593]|uniref:Uncharacterized protein n=1 Tax=Aspergillus ibericus CBS 121593 TaxID=1448316 RepID=A0A395GPS1_9EURO|nr:hypothetical protein BO80DRAFT_392707 [Aspergillus ibericus CBS 121593]RAK96043.1 hypothetical protein BO80DRAFT_392707 [Aspergillus ibericus CBS 121593]
MVFKTLTHLLTTLDEITQLSHDLLSQTLIAQGSHGDHPLYGTYFLNLATTTLPPAAAALAIYQAIEGTAQLRQLNTHLETLNTTLASDNALRVASEFPTLVYNMLQHKIKSEPDDTWYLVYHPDTIWRHHFEDLILTRGVLGERFIGLFQNLDAVVGYMQAMRRVQAERDRGGGGGKRRPHFRLLIPAYYPITVATAVQFPEEIAPFDVYCDVHNGKPLVQMYLPGVKEGEIGNVGLYKPQKGFFEQWFGSGKEDVPRVLGIVAAKNDEEGGKMNEKGIENGVEYKAHSQEQALPAEAFELSGEEYIYEDADDLDRASTVASAGETDPKRHSHRRRSGRHSTSQSGSFAGSDFYSVYSWTSSQSSHGSRRRRRRRHTSQNGSST